MGKIHLLKDELIDKIAAGEVVERPASVIKELVENAIDAGATEIRVELKDGGREMISVTDNGSGMPPDDAFLAIRRHATSKISSVDDLFSVTTMGFRGEALASIASVSRFTILTNHCDQEEGIRLHVEDGKVETKLWSGPHGTTVIVDDLFYNVPVRKGFLKKASAELSACRELIYAMSLAIPEVGFILMHNGKEQFRAPALPLNEDSPWRGEQELRARARLVLGQDDSQKLLYLVKTSKLGTLEALISPPGLERNSTKDIYTFVNGRWVKDRVLRYALQRGYHSHLLKGKYPCGIVHIEMDPTLVDVNVHPSKTELRFQYAQELQDFIAVAIREEIREGAWVHPVNPDGPRGGLDGEVELSRKKTALTMPLDFSFLLPRDEERRTDVTSFRNSRTDSSAGGVSKTLGSNSSKMVKPLSIHTPVAARPNLLPIENEPTFERNSPVPWRELRFIGIFAKCYLFFEHKDELLVADQHALHERLLYEKLCQDRSQLRKCQPLLVPEVLTMAATQIEVLLEKMDLLQENGFTIVPMSAETIEVRAVPALLVNRDLDALISELANSEGVPPRFSLGEESTVIHQIFATIACHGAVRAGEELDNDDLQELIKEAEKVDFYFNCPHGRRIFRWWRKSEVERWFDR